MYPFPSQLLPPTLPLSSGSHFSGKQHMPSSGTTMPFPFLRREIRPYLLACHSHTFPFQETFLRTTTQLSDGCSEASSPAVSGCLAPWNAKKRSRQLSDCRLKVTTPHLRFNTILSYIYQDAGAKTIHNTAWLLTTTSYQYSVLTSNTP